MTLIFEEYKASKIINVHKHVDGPWFWGKYTAHPYIGCRSGCEFCYCRGSRYGGRRDPEQFDTHIKVKINAIDRLMKEIAKLPKDIITVGDWQQPAERRYRLSRQMLEVVADEGFPTLIVERSPALTDDLDLLQEINRKSWVGVGFSFSSLDLSVKRAFEPRSPGVGRRLEAIRQVADAGIEVGMFLMPVLPYISDDLVSLEAAVLAVLDHGGSFVLGGGLTMDGAQAERTLEAYRRYDPSLEGRLRGLYQWPPGGKPTYGPPGHFNIRLGLNIRELCERHGLLDRIPRYILPNSLQVNKKIAEQLFLATYDLELMGASQYKIWAYRKAAWTIDELDLPVEQLFLEQGSEGLQSLPNIGASIADLIGEWLKAT